MSIQTAMSRRKPFCLKILLTLIFELTLIGISLIGLSLMIKNDDILTLPTYVESSCILSGSLTGPIRNGYATVWKSHATGCSIVISPLAFTRNATQAKVQSLLYPLGKLIPCWCDWHNFYEFPLIGEGRESHHITATCYLDEAVVGYMQSWQFVLSAGKIVLWSGLLLAVLANVALAFHIVEEKEK